MSKKPPPGGLEASVHQRLLNLAKARGDEFQFVLTRYSLERLLYRLSRSAHRDRFVLKGAMLFSVQIDIGTGDAVTPSPRLTDFPSLLDFPAPRIRTYPRETVVAEKFQAMVMLHTGGVTLEEIVNLLRRFLLPPSRAIRSDEPFELAWPVGGDWLKSR